MASTKGVTDLHGEAGDLNLEVAEELGAIKQFLKLPLFNSVPSVTGWWCFVCVLQCKLFFNGWCQVNQSVT